MHDSKWPTKGERRLRMLLAALVTLLVLTLAYSAVRVAQAAGTTATVSWVAPDKYLDGVALPLGDIASYTVEWTGTQSGSKTVTTTSTTVNVPCGDTSFTVFVTLKATARVANGKSDPSNAVPYASGVACKPNPPSAVTVS